FDDLGHRRMQPVLSARQVVRRSAQAERLDQWLQEQARLRPDDVRAEQTVTGGVAQKLDEMLARRALHCPAVRDVGVVVGDCLMLDSLFACSLRSQADAGDLR